MRILLLLCGDPGPVEHNNSTEEMWEPFKNRRLQFLHLNINSLLPKVDEVESIANKSKAAVIGISESKLDDAISDKELDISGYNLVRCDRKSVW